jgi:HAD superfamily hydrolase (TIGR01509 family)
VLELNPATGWTERWAARLGMDLATFEGRLEAIWPQGSIGETTLEEIERQTADALDLDASALVLLMSDAWSEYLGSLNENLARYFASLRPRCKTAMLSNSFVGAREREAYGFEDMCDVVAYSHEIGHLKPDPRAYRAVCDLLHVAPQAAVLLDDLQANIDGAVAVGMTGVTFLDNDRAIAEIGDVLAG